MAILVSVLERRINGTQGEDQESKIVNLGDGLEGRKRSQGYRGGTEKSDIGKEREIGNGLQQGNR